MGRRFYTGTGDDGTTARYFGGRVRKDADEVEAVGAIDEAQAAIGVARAETERGGELNELLLSVEHDLYVCMAELATATANRHKLEPGKSKCTAEMVDRITTATDDLATRFTVPEGGFALPGQTRTSALLEVARTVVRRAERRALGQADEGSQVIPYLNRLSSLLWAAARCTEDTAIPAKPKEH